MQALAQDEVTVKPHRLIQPNDYVFEFIPMPFSRYIILLLPSLFMASTLALMISIVEPSVISSYLNIQGAIKLAIFFGIFQISTLALSKFLFQPIGIDFNKNTVWKGKPKNVVFTFENISSIQLSSKETETCCNTSCYELSLKDSNGKRCLLMNYNKYKAMVNDAERISESCNVEICNSCKKQAKKTLTAPLSC